MPGGAAGLSTASPLIVRREHLAILFFGVVLKQGAEKLVGHHGNHEDAARYADYEQSRQHGR